MERNPKRRSTVMHARGRIAVAGATGRVGRRRRAWGKRGHEVVAISRSRGVDVVTGEGLADALAGVATVIDVATQPSPDEDAATAFFTAATRNLPHQNRSKRGLSWRAAGGLRSAIRSLISVTPALDDGGIFQPDRYVRRVVEEASAAG
jgi:putative NADH-flavin reductase